MADIDQGARDVDVAGESLIYFFDKAEQSLCETNKRACQQHVAKGSESEDERTLEVKDPGRQQLAAEDLCGVGPR